VLTISVLQKKIGGQQGAISGWPLGSFIDTDQSCPGATLSVVTGFSDALTIQLERGTPGAAALRNLTM
jgi:hypothetical protein